MDIVFINSRGGCDAWNGLDARDVVQDGQVGRLHPRRSSIASNRWLVNDALKGLNGLFTIYADSGRASIAADFKLVDA